MIIGIDQLLRDMNKGLDLYTITITKEGVKDRSDSIDVYAESVEDALIKIGEYERNFREYRNRTF